MYCKNNTGHLIFCDFCHSTNSIYSSKFSNLIGLTPGTLANLELNKNNPLHAKTYKEYIFDKRTNEWKDKLGNIIIKGFNNETWFQ